MNYNDYLKIILSIVIIIISIFYFNMFLGISLIKNFINLIMNIFVYIEYRNIKVMII